MITSLRRGESASTLPSCSCCAAMAAVSSASHGRAFATRHDAAPQLSPQFLNVIVKRDHRPLLLYRRRDGRTAGSGRVKDAAGAAERGAGEPILSSVDNNLARASALLTLGKIGGTAHPWAGPIRHGMMGNPKR